MSRQRRRLQPEELKQFCLKRVIAKALAGQMNKVKGRAETIGRAFEHCAGSSAGGTAALGAAVNL